MDRPVRTFTVGFSDYEHLNELGWARRVAKHFKTDHHEVRVDEKAMRDYLPSLVFSQDEPIADWVCIPLYFVSKLVRDSGTIVVQVGEGSDEQFSGYKSYMMYLDMFRSYWRPFSRLPRAARGAAAAVARGLFGVTDTQDNYLDIVDRAGRDREPFWSGATVFPESRKARRPDNTHFSLKNVNKLWQLIQFIFPDKLADLCNPGIIVSSRWAPEFLCIQHHRPELKYLKWFPKSPNPNTPIEYRASIFSLDKNCYGQ